jgi:hypothetical protein
MSMPASPSPTPARPRSDMRSSPQIWLITMENNGIAATKIDDMAVPMRGTPIDMNTS